MAVNPDTGIDFNTDRFVIRRDGVLVNMNAPWLRLDGGPVVGGLPVGDEYFWKQPAGDRSAWDHRFSVNGEWQCVAHSPALPSGYPTGEYRETLTAVFRPAAELKAQVDAQRRTANSTIYPEGDDPSERALVDEARTRQAQGIADTRDLAVLQRHAGKVDLLKQNEDRAAALYAAIDAMWAAIDIGVEYDDLNFPAPYDITDGWQYGEGVVAE